MAAAKTADFRGTDLGNHGGEFAGGELVNGFEVGAIFVAEGEVIEEVFDGFESSGGEHGGAGGSDSFKVGQFGGEVQGQVLSLRGGDTRDSRILEADAEDCFSAGF